MGFDQSGTGHLDELRIFAKLLQITGTNITHTGTDTAEGAPFSPQELNALMLLGQKGVAELVQHQQQALQQVQPQNR